MPHPLSDKYPIPISQLCLVNTDVPAGVGAPPLDTTLLARFYLPSGLNGDRNPRTVVQLTYSI